MYATKFEAPVLALPCMFSPGNLKLKLNISTHLMVNVKNW